MAVHHAFPSSPSQIITSASTALNSVPIVLRFKWPQSQIFWYAIPLRKCSGNPKCWNVRASGEWKEYEDAVQEKDLGRALEFLESLDGFPLETSQKGLLEQEDGFVAASKVQTLQSAFFQREMLDTCMNAEDMKLVGRTYEFLQSQGLLPNFGKFKNIGAEFVGTTGESARTIEAVSDLVVTGLAEGPAGTSRGQTRSSHWPNQISSPGSLGLHHVRLEKASHCPTPPQLLQSVRQKGHMVDAPVAPPLSPMQYHEEPLQPDFFLVQLAVPTHDLHIRLRRAPTIKTVP
eukprot:Gb_19833 [translate_table: standard]